MAHEVQTLHCSTYSVDIYLFQFFSIIVLEKHQIRAFLLYNLIFTSGYISLIPTSPSAYKVPLLFFLWDTNVYRPD